MYLASLHVDSKMSVKIVFNMVSEDDSYVFSVKSICSQSKTKFPA